MEKITLYGVTVYTNDELKKKLKVMISQKGHSSSKEILFKLIDDGLLIPVITEPNKIKQLLIKIRRKTHVFNILGTTQTGKCFVILSSSFKSKDIVDTALHETCHLAHRQFPKKFNEINNSIYIRFYSYFYKELFEAKSYDIKIFASFLNKVNNNIFEGELLFKAFKDHTMLSENRIEYRINMLYDILDAISDGKLNLVSGRSFAIMLLRKTYRKLFKDMDYHTGVGQELWNPPEIICVLSTINPDHPNVIKSLELIKPGKKPVIDVKARIKIIKD